MPSKVEAETGVPLPYDALLIWIGECYGPEAEAETRAVHRRAMARYGRAVTLRSARIWLKQYGNDPAPHRRIKAVKLAALLSDPQGYIDRGE